MLKIKEYVRAESISQAYELNQKRSSRILGGMLWMKMSNAAIGTAIDLSGLGLDRIEETPEEIRIGCMASLRQLETSDILERASSGIVRESLKNIVGVQFRNLATIGGSLFGRFGFSDVLTCFLALDTYVELYQEGVISLEEFAGRARGCRDILVRVIVKKTPGRQVYLSHRNTRTDFPVLAIAVSSDSRGARVTAGARPGRAICTAISDEQKGRLDRSACTPDEIGELAAELAAKIPMGSNMRASARYRSHLAEVLIKRGLTRLQEIQEEKG